MPIHDWTKVNAGIFHDFHHEWISQIKLFLNKSLNPEYYALAEQIAGGLGPDVLTLQIPTANSSYSVLDDPNASAVAVAVRPPQVRIRQQSEPDQYANKAKSVVIRHASNHRVVAVVEIVSPGNKSSRHSLAALVSKVIKRLRGGVHLLIIDLFSPGIRDPNGIHGAIWNELSDDALVTPTDCPLTLAAYRAGAWPEAFIEPTAVGLELSEMPLFLETEAYLPLVLEPTYQHAWEAVPKYWRDVIENPNTPS